MGNYSSLSNSEAKIVDWIERQNFEDRQRARREMEDLNIGKAHGRLLPQQKISLDFVFPVEAQKEREATKREFFKQAQAIKKERRKRFSFFENPRTHQVTKRENKTGKFVKLTKSDKRDIVRSRKRSGQNVVK